MTRQHTPVSKEGLTDWLVALRRSAKLLNVTNNHEEIVAATSNKLITRVIEEIDRGTFDLKVVHAGDVQQPATVPINDELPADDKLETSSAPSLGIAAGPVS